VTATVSTTVRRLAAAALIAVAFAACSDGTGPDQPQQGVPDVLLVTSIADQSGSNGSSFVQTVSLEQGSATNTDAYEQVFFPYASIHGNDVIVTQHFYGDQVYHYVRGSDGKLAEAGRMNLPAGSFGANVVFANDTRAYISLVYAGKILIINPQTMTAAGEIDLTTLGIARNPSNPDDRNPEPAVMAIRDGKLYVALQQLTTGFSSADGTDVAVFDMATNQLERVIHDDRATGPGRFGYNQTMFVDESGDLYVYCIASFGYVPGQKAGILRIRNGQNEFDPSYFVNLTDATVGVSGGRIGLLNGIGYGGNGKLYAMAQVPALQSNPPNYATDRAFQALRVTLSTGQIEVLPLPLNNGNATGITFRDGKVLFGLSTATGVGIYSYDPATGQGSSTPVVTTVGDPTLLLAF
jgi:hypothetical protein